MPIIGIDGWLPVRRIDTIQMRLKIKGIHTLRLLVCILCLNRGFPLDALLKRDRMSARHHTGML